MGVIRPPLLVWDVESCGLHGPAYAWGAVLVIDGRVAETHLEWCPPEVTSRDATALGWANEQVVPQLLMATRTPTVSSPGQMRGRFWSLWRAAADEHGAQLAADVVWPVESGFLSACVADDPGGRWWAGPYPILDVASLRVAGLAYKTKDVHQPLTDAITSWLSMRDWWLGE